MKEHAVTFGQWNSLVGIVTDPAPGRSHPRHAVILLNPGIVHRAGPGRIYVKIARALAARGYVVLRFDFSGIGDSGIRRDSLQFEKSAVSETCEAMDFLKATRGASRFILLGGCSGATVSLRTAGSDPRAKHAVLINFPVAGDEEGNESPERLERAKAHYYWNFALLNWKSWRKVLTGKADYGRIFRVLGFQMRRTFAGSGRDPGRETSFAAELRRVAAREVSVTFLCSQGDPDVEDLREAGGRQLEKLCAGRAVALEIIPRSDHTFTSLDDQARLLKAIVKRVETVTAQEAEESNASPLVSRAQEAAIP